LPTQYNCSGFVGLLHETITLRENIGMRVARMVVFCVTALLAGGAWADEVSLKNGDRVSGEVLSMDDAVLVIKTPYAGDIKIDRKEVQGISSTKPITLQTKESSQLRGIVSSPSPDQVTVMSSEFGTTAPIPLSDVVAINAPPLVRYSGLFNLGGAMTKGNSDTKAINGSALYSLRADRHRFTIEGKYNYGEQAKIITVRNALAALKYDFFITKRVYTATSATFEQDTFQDINLRSSLAQSLGYQFLDTKRTQLSAELGIAYVDEDRKIGVDHDSAAGRWAVNFNRVLIADRLIFFHRQEGFYDFGAPNAMRVRAEQGFRVPVYKQFSMNIEYDIRYNSKPTPGFKKTDQIYIVGVSYELPK
jgi:putative salt-induced outer membrane protein YdiY